MRFKFYDGNEIEIVGNKWFVGNVLDLINPIISAYAGVSKLNAEPQDDQRFKVEAVMAKEAWEKGEPFNGKYITYTVDEKDKETPPQ